MFRRDLCKTVLDGERDQLGSAPNLEFAQNPTAMRLCGAMGNIKPGADFRIAQSLSDQRENRTFSIREYFGERIGIGPPRQLRCLESGRKINSTRLEGDQRFVQGLDRIGILVDKPMHSRPFNSEQGIVIAMRRDDEDAQRRKTLEDAIDDVEPVHVRQRQVQNERIGLQPKNHFNRLHPGIRFTYDFVAASGTTGFQNHVPKHQMVVDNNNSHGRDTNSRCPPAQARC